MRQTLIRIFLDEPWALWKVDPVTGYPGAGIAVVATTLMVIWLLWLMATAKEADRQGWLRAIATGIGVVVFATFVPQIVAGKIPSLPVFSYGLMLLIGFLSALLLAQRRGARARISRDLLFDMAFWVLVSGIVGARLFYLIQYHEEVFAGKQGKDLVLAAVNLSKGGIVLYGSLLGGAAAFFWFCWKHSLNALQLADIVMPSVFVGVGFGRIGCLLNGCCYGDRCEQPWGIVFPGGSVPWQELVHRGFLDASAPDTFALHPTQIYSSINAFLIAWVLSAYYPRRRHNGEVFALGCVLYPITRFTIELLRGDEMGQFGTSLTISQITSLGVAAAGLVTLVALSLRGTPSVTQQTPASA